MNEATIMPWLVPIGSAIGAFIAGFLAGRITVMREASGMLDELRQARARLRKDTADWNERIDARRKQLQESALHGAKRRR